ncbi:uncharacterized protein LOC124159859 [Ischnura elegans]|uniref:uncharacterized protein LOC124159859 n=1 Tax=Ischnura elegans TaxID=197161 RepID=UPI001ED8971D|nr:uncharacterized protein LOC124159859 [Ischnura elegans]
MAYLFDYNQSDVIKEMCSCPCFCGIRKLRSGPPRFESILSTFENRLMTHCDFTSSDSDVHIPDSEFSREERRRRKLREIKKYVITRWTVIQKNTVIAAVAYLAFLLVVLTWNLLADLTFMNLHPPLMALSVCCFLGDLILRISPELHYSVTMSFEERAKRLRSLRTYGLLCYVTGFVVVFIDKEMNNECHLMSWHGNLGTFFVFIVLMRDNRLIPKGPVKRWTMANKVQAGLLLILMGFQSDWAYQYFSRFFIISMSALLLPLLIVFSAMMWYRLMYS